MRKVLFAILVYFVGVSFYGWHIFKEEVPEPIEPTLVKVEINGAVLIPGDYNVSQATTLAQLISYAGGLTLEADVEIIDFQEVLSSNKSYFIPFRHGKEKINLNFASLTELLRLEGIGQAKAEAIINYRKNNGLFNSIIELKNVNGIGEKVYEKIKHLITV
ncbi:MAG: hypothetical protein GX149_00730 [Acholeplasmataceae bacterium]|jgi:competence protein ComEA|nr:hypothetical protein [Acholeplasmataceae bacterium]